MGVTLTEKGFHVNVVSEGTACAMHLYRRNEADAFLSLPFSPEEKMGSVWSLDVREEDVNEKSGFGSLAGIEYNFEDDDGIFADPYGLSFSGRDAWGKVEQYGNPLRSPLVLPEFDWEDDAPPRIPYEDTIIYRLHVRGFTKSPSSGVVQKGTFDGIIEKIPYLKELGVTTVELLPCQEFEELMVRKSDQGAPAGAAPEKPRKADGRVNYWGYAPANHFAPKAGYCRKKDRSPVNELRALVKALHKAGMEIILEFYFDGSRSASYVIDVLRYYVRFYHIDGVHISGYADAAAVAGDPYLSEVKLIAEGWNTGAKKGRKRLAAANENFEHDMRRILKGDEGMLNSLVYHTRNNPAGFAVINFMANTNGFTMADMVSYDIKHNEANGEDNADGTDMNFSWNCGAEGPSRKTKIRELRNRQLRNAFMLLLLSQGTPLILAGDEFGQTQGGNNNPYCQDGPVTWLNWKLGKTNEELLAFVKKLIAFRKAHRVFHYAEAPKLVDFRATGIPDVSYHGVRTWQPEFEAWRRQLGILYNGAYACDAAGTPDSTFYVMYNMHWEPCEFSLPKPGRGEVWHPLISTAAKEYNGFLPEDAPALEDQKTFTMPPRAIMVLVARPAPPEKKKKGGKKKAAGKKKEKEKAGEKAEAREAAEAGEKAETREAAEAVEMAEVGEKTEA